MPPRSTPSRSRSSERKADPYPASALAELGLREGERVRFRRSEGERWKFGTVDRREKDGSIGLHDAKGAARSIAIDLVEVEAVGPRGGVTWEPLTERAGRTEQLAMVRAEGRTKRAARPSVDGTGAPTTGTPETPPSGPDDTEQLSLLPDR